MESIFLWLGIIFPLALGAAGSSIGCSIAGTSLAGAMTRTKSGHGALIAMSAAPSSQTIYGLVLMMQLLNFYEVYMKIDIAKRPVELHIGYVIFGIGLLCGIAIMLSAIMQGKCSAAGIRATIEEKSVYGKCWIPVGVTESFAVFAMIFGLIAIGGVKRIFLEELLKTIAKQF